MGWETQADFNRRAHEAAERGDYEEARKYWTWAELDRRDSSIADNLPPLLRWTLVTGGILYFGAGFLLPFFWYF